MSFVEWIHVSNNFISCNVNTILKVEDVQGYKLVELMGSKLHHNLIKIIFPFINYQKLKVIVVQRFEFCITTKKFKFENYLLPVELLFRNIYTENQRNESILHLKSKIKDVGLPSFRYTIKTTIALKTSLKKNTKHFYH